MSAIAKNLFMTLALSGALFLDASAQPAPSLCDPALIERVIAEFLRLEEAPAVIVAAAPGASVRAALYPSPTRQGARSVAWDALNLPQAALRMENLFFEIETPQGNLWIRAANVLFVRRPQLRGDQPADVQLRDIYGQRGLSLEPGGCGE